MLAMWHADSPPFITMCRWHATLLSFAAAEPSPEKSPDLSLQLVRESIYFIVRLCYRYEQEALPEYASARLWDDGVIDPADTRRVLGMALDAAVQGVQKGTKTSFGVFRM